MTEVSAGQSVLETVLRSAMEHALDAKARGDEKMLTPLYMVLSTAYSHADVLDLEFLDKGLREFDPDSLLK